MDKGYPRDGLIDEYPDNFSFYDKFEKIENKLLGRNRWDVYDVMQEKAKKLAGKLLKEHYENMSLEHDQALCQTYELAYQKYHKKEDLLASIILKAQMLGFYPEVELTSSQEELDFLHDYLFSVTIWGIFELNLFSLTSPLFSSRLYRQYTEELVQREDFKLLLDSSRPALNSIFLNGFFLAISSNEFEDVFSPSLRKQLFTVSFMEDRNGLLKTHSTISKNARGAFLTAVMKENCRTIDALRELSFDEFYYRKDLSSDSELVFVKKVKKA